MTGEGLFVFSLKTKSVMPFFAIFPAETSSWYYEYIKITTLGTNYTSYKVYVYTRVRDRTNFNPNDIRIDGCVNAYGIKNLVTQFTRYCVTRLRYKFRDCE